MCYLYWKVDAQFDLQFASNEGDIMETEPERASSRWAVGLSALAIILAVLAISLPHARSTGTSAVSALDVIRQTNVLRIGYEGYPPYTVDDPRSSTVSGYSVDLANAIAKETNWKIVWVKTGPDTKIPDLKTGKFDVMVEPIFATISRAEEVTFTQPYAYFGYASGIVRKGDTRFRSIDALNARGVTIAVRQGYTDEAFVREHLPLATIRSMQVDDISKVFLDVIAGNSDIALADTIQVRAFYTVHSTSVDELFVDPPPASVPAGFIIRQGDSSFENFLDTSLNYLRANGTIEGLDKKYGVKSSPGTQ
jgi:ABC-type amino acid transport substrate-binding protein